MRQILVKHFGPIANGYNAQGGFIHLPKVSVFSGPQASGKSTIVKMVSTFAWMEKALVRGDFSREYLTRYNRFNKICTYQNLQNYFTDDTVLHYKGDAYQFMYSNKRLDIIENIDGGYQRPQIIYVPAERNLLSVIEQADRVKGLPESLATMLEEYNKACRSIDGDTALPIDGVYFRYDKLNRIAKLSGEGYSVRLSEASSGLQSVTPLYIVLEYLSKKLQDKNGVKTASQRSLEEKDIIDSRIEELLRDNTLTYDERLLLLRRTADTGNKCLLSIIEEPEQNLFPQSQNAILHYLLRINTAQPNNQLILTTHSPYIIDYLSLHIKAGALKKKLSETMRRQFVPINGDDVSVFECSLDGSIRQLEKYDKMPSDNNLLNNALMESNDLFNSLLELGDE